MLYALSVFTTVEEVMGSEPIPGKEDEGQKGTIILQGEYPGEKDVTRQQRMRVQITRVLVGSRGPLSVLGRRSHLAFLRLAMQVRLRDWARPGGGIKGVWNGAQLLNLGNSV